MSALLAAVAVALSFAAAWEFAGAIEGRRGRALARIGARLTGGRSTTPLALARGIGQRIERAGLAGRVEVGAVLALKAAGAGLGVAVAALAIPVAPGRLAVPVVAMLVVAGFMAPDALLERAGRRRRERAVAALPDVLDMLAVGTASGRDAIVVLGEIASSATGPLAQELAGTVASIEAGMPPRDAFAALRRRIAGGELGALVAALERARSHGSPLADQLRLQATALRRDERRRIEERAARAAPKIQLVVALVLVPSVLLTILAAILAHSDALFGVL